MGRVLDETVEQEPFTYKDREGKTYQTMRDVYRFRFNVEKSWKGAPDKIVTLSSTLSDCMKWFEKSRLYLVYAYKWNFELETSGCTRTREAKDIEIEQLFLDAAVMGQSERKIYSEVIKMAQTDPHSNLRLQALEFLDRSLPDTLPPNWIEAMIEVFQDKNQRVRARATTMRKYKNYGHHPGLRAALSHLLGDEWYTVRIAASDGLRALIYDHDEQVAAALVAALEQEKIKMRKITLLREPNRKVIRSFAKSIAKIGGPKDRERVFPYFIQDLSSQDIAIQHSAVVYLGSYGKMAEPAVPQIIEIYKSAPPLQKKIFEVVLRNIGTPEAKKALAQLN